MSPRMGVDRRGMSLRDSQAQPADRTSPPPTPLHPPSPGASPLPPITQPKAERGINGDGAQKEGSVTLEGFVAGPDRAPSERINIPGPQPPLSLSPSPSRHLPHSPAPTTHPPVHIPGQLTDAAIESDQRVHRD